MSTQVGSDADRFCSEPYPTPASVSPDRETGCESEPGRHEQVDRAGNWCAMSSLLATILADGIYIGGSVILLIVIILLVLLFLRR